MRPASSGTQAHSLPRRGRRRRQDRPDRRRHASDLFRWNPAGPRFRGAAAAEIPGCCRLRPAGAPGPETGTGAQNPPPALARPPWKSPDLRFADLPSCRLSVLETRRAAQISRLQAAVQSRVLKVSHCHAPPVGEVAEGTQEQSVAVVGACERHRSGAEAAMHAAPFSTAQSVTPREVGMHSSVVSKLWLPAGQGDCRPSAVQGGCAARPVVSSQHVRTVRAQVPGAQLESCTLPSAQANAPVASQ